MKKKVSIVLPVFNEKDNLEKTVLSILNLQKKLKNHVLHVVISDSHSTDGTSEIGQSLSKKNKKICYINGGSGLGVGLRNGHLYAINRLKSDILVQIDADGQADEKVILSLIKSIDRGYDLALGSRFIKGGKNELSFLRKIFSFGSSLFCRVIMGPFDIQEFTNSARAFTPKLFNNVNWKRLPWRRKTFIYMPAFLNEAIFAGAKYIEVPLVFKNRNLGYSKNKIVNYTLDIVIYSIEARLRKWGIFNSFLFDTIRK